LEANRGRRIRAPVRIVALIRGMHPGLKKKVRASLEIILSDPTAGKALRDDLTGLRSFRAGRVRIVYRVSDSEVQIVAVGPRSRVYEETFRLVKREATHNTK
jgi:mRNA interferase RelE/StbE